MRQHLGLIVITAAAAAVYIFPAFLLENSLLNRQGFTRFPSQNYPVELPLPPPKVCVNHHIAMSEWHDSGTHRVSVFNHSVRLTSSPKRISLLIGLSGEVQAEALPVVRVSMIIITYTTVMYIIIALTTLHYTRHRRALYNGHFFLARNHPGPATLTLSYHRYPWKWSSQIVTPSSRRNDNGSAI